MSHDLTMLTLQPSSAACLACTKIRVSASSWLQGATPSRLIARVLTTSCSSVAMTTFAVHISVILSGRKIKTPSLTKLASLVEFSHCWSLCVWLPCLTLILFQLSDLTDGKHQTQCLYSGTLSNTLVLKEGHPILHTFQMSLTFVGTDCSPKLSHQ